MRSRRQGILANQQQFRTSNSHERNGSGTGVNADLGSVGHLGHDDRLILGRDALTRSWSARNRPGKLN